MKSQLSLTYHTHQTLQSQRIRRICAPVWLIGLMITGLVFSSLWIYAKSTTWNTTTGGAWTTLGNWTNGVPSNGDDVIINSDQSAAITNHPAISLNSLTINGNCNLRSDAGSGNTRLITITGSFSVAVGKTLTLGIIGTGRTDFTLAAGAIGTINGTVYIAAYTGSMGTYNRTFSNDGNLTIAINGLITGDNTGSKGSVFTLGSGSTLQIANTAGIQGGSGSGPTGAVQTWDRNFDVNAHYVYNGTANQNTGTGYPTALTGSLTIDNPNTVTIVNAARTITTGILNLVRGIFATNNGGNRLSLGSTATVNRSEGSMTGTLQGTGTYDVNYTGNSKTTGPEMLNSGLRNVTVNMNAGQTLTSATTAFVAVNNVTVQQGTFTLQAVNANYTVGNDLTVSSGATLKHSVYWSDTPPQYVLLSVGGDLLIDGTYDYSAVPRAHVQMSGSGTKYIRTPNTSLSIFTLLDGDYYASGNINVNDNFWSMIGSATGTFHTNGYTVTAFAAVLNNGGTVYIDGGTLNVTGGIQIGTGNNGACVVSSGTLNADNINIGNGTQIGTLTQTGGTVNITGNLLINPSCSYTCSGSPAINIGGNWTNNGTYTRATETVTCNGTSQQTIGGGSITNFYNLSVNNSAGVVLGNDESAGGTLTLLNGLITTGSNAMVLGNNAIINGAGTGKYVYGNLRWNFPAGAQTRNFAVGDASNYTPVTIAFANVTTPGNVTGSTTGAEHPSILTSTIDQDKDINRYWTMTNSGTLFTTYDATFNYVAVDIDPGADPNAFMVGKYDAGSWIYPTVGTRTGTSIQVTGLTAFSGFAAGQGAAPPTMFIQPVSQSACSGGTASFTASANSIPPSSVVWEVSTDGGLTFAALSTTPPPYSVSTSSNAGITTSVLTINPVTGLNSYQYRAVFTNNKGSCTSSAATLTVNTLPTFTVISTNVSCYGGNDGAIQVNVTPSPGNYYFSQDGGTNYTQLTATPYTFTGLVAGTAYIITVKDGNGCVQTNCP